MTRDDQERLMQRALALACRAWGDTHPNPMVGAVIVESGEIVSEGYHARAGEAHAEVQAIAALNRPVTPETRLFVTLEPCSTTGRTGACTEAILASGIRHVVVGAHDPNPAHAGKGLEFLRKNGLQVVEGILEQECSDLNLIYNHWIVSGTPLLAGKVAVTMDGKIATRMGESKWITGEEARKDVMRWRRLFPGIAVGPGTAISDNPRLTSRLEEEWCPVRFVFDGLLRTANQRTLPAVFTDDHRDRTVVVTTELAGTGYIRMLNNLGVSVWVFPSETGRIPNGPFRERCVKEGIQGVLIEGGTGLLSSMILDKGLDYLFNYRSGILFGDAKARAAVHGVRTEKLVEAVRLTNIRHGILGDDQLMRGHINYPERMNFDETMPGHQQLF